jgi:hypothetical protein
MDKKLFASLLSAEPPQHEISTFSGRDYLSISYVENKLDEIFGIGEWSFVISNSTVIGNEITMTGVLEFTHPITGKQIQRGGTAACQIRQKAGADVLDVSAKIKNALVMDIPHCKSECLKNAAKSIGKAFGRDLNRDKVDTYNPTETLESIADAIELLNSCTTITQLQEAKTKIDFQSVVVKAHALKVYQSLTPQLQQRND